MLEKKLLKRICLSFVCVLFLAQLMFVIFEQTVTAQDVWRVELEEGKTASSTLTINNSCKTPHNFTVKEDMKYLSFTEQTQSILIAPGASKLVGVKFDATGLKPKVYEDDVLIVCLDCKKEPTCAQDKDKVPVQLTVTKPTSSQDIMPTTTSSQAKIFSATCFCKISIFDLTNKKSASGVILDLTSAVGKTYGGVNPQSDKNQTDCNTRCTTEAAKHTGSQSIASAACAAGAANGTVVRAYSAVGTREYKSAQQIGILINTPRVTETTCKCPQGWFGTNGVDGGPVPVGGRCAKGACGPINILPLPPNNTQVGTWGFIWGNALYAFGTQENGGAAICVTKIIKEAECRFQ